MVNRRELRPPRAPPACPAAITLSGCLFGRSEIVSTVEQGPRGLEHAAQHRARELAREGVLLAGMVGPDQRGTVGEARDGGVTEEWQRARQRLPARPASAQVGEPADPSEPDDDPRPLEQAQLLEQVRLTAGDLFQRRLVGGRRTPDRGRDVGVSQAQPVLGVLGRRLIGEPRLPERAIEPVAASTASTARPPSPRTRQPAVTAARTPARSSSRPSAGSAPAPPWTISVGTRAPPGGSRRLIAPNVSQSVADGHGRSSRPAQRAYRSLSPVSPSRGASRGRRCRSAAPLPWPAILGAAAAGLRRPSRALAPGRSGSGRPWW